MKLSRETSWESFTKPTVLHGAILGETCLVLQFHVKVSPCNRAFSFHIVSPLHAEFVNKRVCVHSVQAARYQLNEWTLDSGKSWKLIIRLIWPFPVGFLFLAFVMYSQACFWWRGSHHFHERENHRRPRLGGEGWCNSRYKETYGNL